MDYYFDHEKLQVYQLARELNREVVRLLGRLPRGHADSRDNLRRASMSVSRNIAEGAGKWRVPDKIHFYQIARASATECAASLDELVDCAGLKSGDVEELKRTAARIVAMLISMIRSLETRTAAN
ncbi:MAG TPA: four helix bundle protein [Longimicrobiales bacterium]|nr:four helix bundle protein [Longimicrobiales bacterium]